MCSLYCHVYTFFYVLCIEMFFRNFTPTFVMEMNTDLNDIPEKFTLH